MMIKSLLLLLWPVREDKVRGFGGELTSVGGVQTVGVVVDPRSAWILQVV